MATNSSQIIEFLELVSRLKHLKRTGWVERNVENPECVAGHMYRMSIMAFLISDTDSLDKTKCIKLSLAHDLAECIVGDLTPNSGVDPAEKHRLEDEAMQKLTQLVGPPGEELYMLFKEYEDQNTPEAKFVKDLDRFDMVLQAFEYEKRGGRPHELQDFFESTKNKFSHPFITSLVTEVNKQRAQFESSQNSSIEGIASSGES
ncbi:hypothetical protein R5R35_007425 [Gryllus longicercus]|uniref:5'-deoxynucleotidase HDDC2 n=1 Tax=Gryllus longicercus TaxID=2509291 RepID=A0AAN9V650_9ORTH